MAFKFIYITDTHFYNRAPRSRTDDYLKTGLQKLDRVIRHANNHGITRIICGGDVFGRGSAHAKNLAWGSWRRIAERIEEQGHIDWHLNVGQHDLDAHHHKSLMEMPLGALSLLSNIHILPHDERVNIGHAGETPIYIVGRWFDFRWSQTPEFYRLGPEHRKSDREFLILTAHGLLVDEKFVGPHVLLSDVGQSEANLYLASDYHPGWKTRRAKGGRETVYLAPGSMMRTEKPAEQRMPKLVRITIEEDGTVDWRVESLTDQYPFRSEAKALIREHVVEDEKVFEGITDKIAQETGSIRFVDVVDYVSQIATETEVENAVRECTLRYIGRAQEHLGKGK